MAERLNIIGAGHVGTTLGILFAREGYEIDSVLARTEASAARAARLIGYGEAVMDLDSLAPADFSLITTPDDKIAETAQALAASGRLAPGSVAFHCSGATSAEALAVLRSASVAIASVHPLKTFTDPIRDAESFQGTFCALDGDDAALRKLTPVFEAFGVNCARIESAKKLHYHASAVFLSNYLHVLTEAALMCLETAGIDRTRAVAALRPILTATAENTLNKGPASALTGPIARGDAELVSKQLSALKEADPDLGELYRVLGREAVKLSEQRGVASADSLAKLRKLLDGA